MVKQLKSCDLGYRGTMPIYPITTGEAVLIDGKKLSEIIAEQKATIEKLEKKVASLEKAAKKQS